MIIVEKRVEELRKERSISQKDFISKMQTMGCDIRFHIGVKKTIRQIVVEVFVMLPSDKVGQIDRFRFSLIRTDRPLISNTF